VQKGNKRLPVPNPVAKYMSRKGGSMIQRKRRAQSGYFKHKRRDHD
jgi:hypothetical protein